LSARVVGTGAHDYGGLLDALRGVRWAARMRPRTSTVGAHTARRIGPNVEVTEYRPYRQGDDPRRLDWKLLARTDRAYVRLAPDIATAPTLLVLDASASMGAGLGGESKWRMARGLCVGLGAVARASGDPVGLSIAHGDGTRRIPVRARGDSVRELIRVVDGIAAAGAPPVTPLLEHIRGVERVVVISDLLGDLDALLQRAASLMARGVDVVVAHVISRIELDPDAARAVAVDPENAAFRRPLSRSALTEYRREFTAFRSAVRRDVTSVGARHVEVIDDLVPADAVKRVVRVASGVSAERAS
jgi:uncharacterized protein (DUF58 family)